MQASDLGLPTASLAAPALGRTGARYLVSLIVGVVTIGWFGVQTAVCGASLALMLADVFGLAVPVWACSTALGALMLATALVGFDGLKWVSSVAAPLLVAICLYGVGASVAQTGSLDALLGYVPLPADAIGLIAGVNMAVGLFAFAGATAGDFARFARTRKDAVLSCVVGVIPAALVALLAGAALAIVTGQGDIARIMNSIGLPAVGLIALVLSAWTVNASNVYSAGLGFAVMLGKGEGGSKLTTAVSGVAGIVLAVGGILGQFEAFLTVLSACGPALAGVMVADYWLVRKGRPGERARARRRVRGGRGRACVRHRGGARHGRHVRAGAGAGSARPAVLRRAGERHRRGDGRLCAVLPPDGRRALRGARRVQATRGICYHEPGHTRRFGTRTGRTSMRKIGIQEIEDIALGAALLGAGGGGDPYIGKLTAIGAVKECGEVELIGIDEVPDGAFIMPAASMGAPTILAEKGVGANEFAKLFDMVSRYYGKPIYATMPIEAGGVNSMLPIAAAARLGIPMVDVDGMGRAFPELQMVTFTIGGASATPMAFIDEKGNSGILDTITNKWTEDIARAATMTMGGTLTIALFCMDVDTCKQYGVHGIVTRSEELGRAIRTAKDEAAAAGLTPEGFFLKFTGGHKLFKGKISDVLRETRGAFNFGRVVLEGIGEDRGSQAFVDFQNENLSCVVDGQIKATVPDLICLVDPDTFTPVPPTR